MSNQNELYHYGVLGMKWGRRKARMSQDAREVKAIKKKKISEMSNAELRKLNERQNLERNHRQLNPNAIKRGLSIVGATAGAMGTVIALKNNGQQIIDIGKTIAHNSKYKQMKLF